MCVELGKIHGNIYLCPLWKNRKMVAFKGNQTMVSYLITWSLSSPLRPSLCLCTSFVGLVLRSWEHLQCRVFTLWQIRTSKSTPIWQGPIWIWVQNMGPVEFRAMKRGGDLLLAGSGWYRDMKVKLPLVGGYNPSEKSWSSSVGMIIPN